MGGAAAAQQAVSTALLRECTTEHCAMWIVQHSTWLGFLIPLRLQGQGVALLLWHKRQLHAAGALA
jgi:hypothetical protein